MKRIAIAIGLLILPLVLRAQDQPGPTNLAGTWQGTLHVGAGLRTVLRVSSDGQGGW